MTTAGIIAEFNPFHSGHAALFGELRRGGADCIAAVMSGNFVQRGDAAVLSKWARAEQAVRCGADLVAELPLPWASGGAERFAEGGVFLLDALGADRIGFGSECGSLAQLQQAREALASPLLHDRIRESLSLGKTFAAARQQAVESLFGPEIASLLASPNNILGIEYLKAAEKFGSAMKPIAVKRTGTPHDAAASAGQHPSSSAVRSVLARGGDVSGFLPAQSYDVLRREVQSGRAPASLAAAERAVLAKLRSMSKQEFSLLPDLSEGLENRLFSASRLARSLPELYDLVKTKRYPLARIRRLILYAFLGLEASDCPGTPPYLRILAVGPNGAELLRKAGSRGSVPIIARRADLPRLEERGRKIFRLENRASDLYALCTPEIQPCGLDLSHKIVTF